MNINTDREIFGYVKNLMRDCRFDDIIDIYFTCPSQDEGIGANRFNIDNVDELVGKMFDLNRFNIDNVDELVGKMFDLSLTKRVSAIHAFGGKYGYVTAFEVVFSESSDHQTNITPRMIDFFRMIVDPFFRDTLVEALKPKPQPMEEDYLNWDGKFIIAPMVEKNPWEYFEGEGDGYV